MVIRSFRCRDTGRLYQAERIARFANIESVSRRRLDALHVATTLRDLSARPGNRLEALLGDRIGQYSIRVNDQYRIVFRFEGGNALDVRVMDYH